MGAAKWELMGVGRGWPGGLRATGYWLRTSGAHPPDGEDGRR
jgi:hypothetical protein